MVAETIGKTGVHLGDKPAAFLLFDIPMSVEKYKNSLPRHILIAVRACIPVQWKTASSLSRAQWFVRIVEIQQMESLILVMKDQDERYRKTWAPYMAYKEELRVEG